MMVTLQYRTRAARAWAFAMRVVAPIVGRQRAYRWAEAGFWRLSRWRIGTGGPWLPLPSWRDGVYVRYGGAP